MATTTSVHPVGDDHGAHAATVVPAKADSSTSLGKTANGGDDTRHAKNGPAATDKEREAGWGDYFRCFAYAKHYDYALMAGAAFASIGAGVTMPLMNVVFGKLVGSFASFGTPGASTTSASLGRTIDRQCLYMFILFLARFILNYVSKFTLRMIGIRISAAIRMDYLASLFAQTIHVLDTMPSGAAAGTITSDANTLQIGLSEKLGTFVEYLSTIISAIIIAFIYSWNLTLVTASCVVFIALAVAIFLPFIIKGTERHTKAEAKAGSVATESFAAIRMIYACGAQGRMVERYDAYVKEAKKHGLYTVPFMAIQFGLIFFGFYSGFALCFWYGTKAYAAGQVDGIGTVIIVLMNVFLMAMSLQRMSTPLIAASKATVAAATFFAVIDAPKPDKGHLKEPDVNANGDIVFENVTFAYPGRPSTKVLDNLNLTIQAGRVTAIVGPSGSGKSTIVGLLERWYSLHEQATIRTAIAKDRKKKKASKDAADPSDDEKEKISATLEQEKDAGPPVQLTGRIVTSGQNLDDINVKWWRSQIGLVQQEPFLFNETIYVNVMHGLVGTQWENEPLEVKQQLAREACKEAFADEFINRLPEGYETQVGDSGLKLSGGQRQRIAIARSIVKKPKILILDEATSAIDVRSEKIIQAALDRVSKGRTTITIAHRLSTIAKADNIVVMTKGVLMEQGTHEELLKNEAGVYSGLVRAQKLAFDDGGDETEGSDEKEPENLEVALSREKSAAVVEGGLDDTDIESEWKTKGLFGSFGRLLWELRSRFPFYIIILVFTAVLGASIPMQAYLYAQVITVFTILDKNEFLTKAAFWSLMWFILAISVGVSHFMVGFVAVSLQHDICAVYRQQYFQALIRQHITFYDREDNSVGTLTARVQGDPKQLEELLGMNMGMVVSSMFQLVGALCISFAYGWKLALVATCVTIPLGLSCAYYRFKHEIHFEKMSAAVFAESSKWAAEAIGAFRCVSSLTLEDVINDRYKDLLQLHVTTAYRKARWSTLIFALSDSMSLACQALIFWYGGHLLARGEYSVTTFFVCFMAVMQGAESAGIGFSFGPNAAQATGAANRILSIRESSGEHSAQKTIADAAHANEKEGVSWGEIPDSETGIKIELRDVGFKYPTRDVSIFKRLNITVEKGQFVALVGSSGAGKSSIVGLLERFYDVQSGSVLCNGKDIRELDIYEYRKKLSLVAQEPTLFQGKHIHSLYLCRSLFSIFFGGGGGACLQRANILTPPDFSGTIKENILLGVSDPSSITDAQLHSVCRDAAIHDFIVSLPEGYNTDVGSRGVALSGGQKQRIAIARAIIRDPKVLLLDEATSSLDSESEKQISAALQRVAKGRTTVAVAHRLSTIQHADVIYVLGEGRVLEMGTHAELLKKKGMYFSMVCFAAFPFSLCWSPRFFSKLFADFICSFYSARARLSINRMWSLDEYHNNSHFKGFSPHGVIRKGSG